MVLTLVLVVAGVAVLVAAALVGREARRSGWRVLRARLRRSTLIWLLAARRAVRFAAMWVLRRDREQVEAFHLRTAEQVFELVGGMKGAIMKLGQMVSILGEGLPEPYAGMMKNLQQQAPPMAYELAAGVVEEELGAPPEVVFRRFSIEPVAAASIGQVHRARLDDGTNVAVKIQYPGVDVAITADLDNAFLLSTVAKVMAPGMDPEPLIAELKERMHDELDYRKEAANQEAFRRAYEGHPWVRIPRVVPELSGRRVLVSEWVQGRSFYDLLERPQEERDRVGEQLFRFFVGSVGRLHFFNADPHPGNYFFADDGTVWFLDFGMVKRFGEQVAQNLVDQITALRDHDNEALRQAMIRHGWFKADAPVDMDRARELAVLLHDALLEYRPYTFTNRHVWAAIEAVMAGAQGPYGDVLRHMTVPPDHLMLNRIQLAVSALLAQLGSTCDWASIFDEYLLGAPPSTPMGEAVREWPRAEGG